MRSYGQYCPIARASEVLAERWSPIILRNLLLGSTTFSEIAAGAPRLSRTLLTTRLRELERLPLPPHRCRPGPGERSEVCRKDPGFEVELYVEAEPAALAEWHLGRIEWADALRTERIRVLGPAPLARALPTWNLRSPAANVRAAG
jgi:HxlR-like helix-turn-helix